MDALRRAEGHGALHHAYLFAGPEGSGKREAALWLAQLANCEGAESVPPVVSRQPSAGSVQPSGFSQQPSLLEPAPLGFDFDTSFEEPETPDGEPDTQHPTPKTQDPTPDPQHPEPAARPCGVCRHCRLIAAGSHPDVSWVIPLEKSKAGKITIEQARDARTEISRMPVLGRRKVMVIAPAEEMTLDAVNCLLKTLEEPPANATLVLLAADTANVIPTVLSRCQVARLVPVPESIIADYLSEQGADRPTAERLARLSEGRPGAALRLYKNEDALPARERALDWLQAVAAAAPIDALKLAEDLRAGLGGENADTPDALHWAGAWFRDILALQCGAPETALLNRDRRDALARAAARYAPAQTQSALAALLRTRRHLAGNGNATLVTEALLFDLIPEGERR